MMITKWLKTALLACLAAILIQCSPIDATQAPVDSLTPVINDVQNLETQLVSVTPGQPNTMNEPQTPSAEAPPVDSGLQSLINQAKEDLAQRLSISLTQINLVEAREVVWPDASLGCPQPGMKYKQVPEDGARIILQVGEINYPYHNGGSRGLFLCEKLYKDPNPPPKLDIFNLTPSSQDKNTSSPTTPDNSIPPGEDQ